jgi:hypothetical protein
MIARAIKQFDSAGGGVACFASFADAAHRDVAAGAVQLRVETNTLLHDLKL